MSRVNQWINLIWFDKSGARGPFLKQSIELVWHVQNCDLIGSLFCMQELHVFYIHLDYEHINPSQKGALDICICPSVSDTKASASVR